MGLTLKPEAWQGPPRESEAEERTASRSRVPAAQTGPARGSAGVAGGAWAEPGEHVSGDRPKDCGTELRARALAGPGVGLWPWLVCPC